MDELRLLLSFDDNIFVSRGISGVDWVSTKNSTNLFLDADVKWCVDGMEVQFYDENGAALQLVSGKSPGEAFAAILKVMYG